MTLELICIPESIRELQMAEHIQLDMAPLDDIEFEIVARCTANPEEGFRMKTEGKYFTLNAEELDVSNLPELLTAAAPSLLDKIGQMDILDLESASGFHFRSELIMPLLNNGMQVIISPSADGTLYIQADDEIMMFNLQRDDREWVGRLRSIEYETSPALRSIADIADWVHEVAPNSPFTTRLEGFRNPDRDTSLRS